MVNKESPGTDTNKSHLIASRLTRGTASLTESINNRYSD